MTRIPSSLPPEFTMGYVHAGFQADAGKYEPVRMGDGTKATCLVTGDTLLTVDCRPEQNCARTFRELSFELGVVDRLSLVG